MTVATTYPATRTGGSAQAPMAHRPTFRPATLEDRVRIRQLLALGMIEAVHVDGTTRYRTTGTTSVRNIPLKEVLAERPEYKAVPLPWTSSR